ncbi:MAG: metallophosphoesterase, partial [Chloroflexota bacterium]
MIKLLFLSDTHLGFDQPIKPKIVRRRRGPDFFRNYHRALQAGIEGEVDLVIHGGDMFFRSRVPT